jgi:hypothetical protein
MRVANPLPILASCVRRVSEKTALSEMSVSSNFAHELPTGARTISLRIQH